MARNSKLQSLAPDTDDDDDDGDGDDDVMNFGRFVCVLSIFFATRLDPDIFVYVGISRFYSHWMNCFALFLQLYYYGLSHHKLWKHFTHFYTKIQYRLGTSSICCCFWKISFFLLEYFLSKFYFFPFLFAIALNSFVCVCFFFTLTFCLVLFIRFVFCSDFELSGLLVHKLGEVLWQSELKSRQNCLNGKITTKK